MKRLFSKKTKTQYPAQPLTTPQRSEAAKSVAGFLQIVEVRDAAPFIAALFRRRFGGDPPDFPRHFVALYRNGDGQWQSVGYVHFTRHKHDYLCGGLVMDERAYRRILPAHRQQIAAIGGIAELLLRESFILLGDYQVIWGYVGDKQAEKVDLRVGFEHTTHPYIMAVWRKNFSEKVKRQKLQRIIALGSF